MARWRPQPKSVLLNLRVSEIIEDNTESVPLDPVPRSLGAKIIRNVLSGGLRYILVFPIPFVMTPLVLHKVGVSGYGTWAVFLGPLTGEA